MSTERLMVVSNGVNKETNEPFSILKVIREGKNKETQQPYAFLEDKSFHKETEILPIGTILTYQRQRISGGAESLERSSHFPG